MNRNSDDDTKQPQPSWQLPEGIEEHIESGLINAAAGAATGAIMGAMFFKRGRGYVPALALAGVGVAIGSTVERARGSLKT